MLVNELCNSTLSICYFDVVYYEIRVSSKRGMYVEMNSAMINSLVLTLMLYIIKFGSQHCLQSE
jgi:hypothetical protein